MGNAVLVAGRWRPLRTSLIARLPKAAMAAIALGVAEGLDGAVRLTATLATA